MLAASLIGRAVKGNGQAELRGSSASRRICGARPLVETVILRAPDLSAPGRVEDAQGLEQIVVIGQRLAHAHDDQIIDHPRIRRASGLPSPRSTARTWLTISSTARLRFQPSRPLAQNLQP